MKNDRDEEGVCGPSLYKPRVQDWVTLIKGFENVNPPSSG